jgi:hypothetical protein
MIKRIIGFILALCLVLFLYAMVRQVSFAQGTPIGGGGACYESYSGSCMTGFTNKGVINSYGLCVKQDNGNIIFWAKGGCGFPANSAGCWGKYWADGVCYGYAKFGDIILCCK